ncbi:toll/interleukin-1 receptor domain-containing protein [Enterovirga sp.]|mgnify:CR=1 FL=1|uniref:toll/interleukin-1 receptor domain-containing protein n=1 Tax=Enterovirga sp. TaxID=2026350 RepID=UPI002B7707CE|nr:toll/interleukin-1 receptor domain-containing protein [Enterovirga sp.]HMO30091.1 toll/interleukin-1 receptor domain-containing protein [Enterovirga sp.]
MQTIALSYRRDDSQAITGRLFDRLSAHFGRDRVFRDIDSISPGSDFRLQVEEAFRQCGVLIAVIGRAWRGSIRGGRARILDESDPVRIEIEIALRQGVPIIPVLVGPTRMPAPDQVPASIQSLLFRHGCRIDPGEDFDHHADRLIREIERSVIGMRKEPSPSPEEEDGEPAPAWTGRPEAAPRPAARDYGRNRLDYVLEGREPPSSRDRAPAQWGGYARSSLSHYPGTYLVMRPAFKQPANIYTYLVDVSWDDAGGGLVFAEKARADSRHTQHGRIWIPNPSNHLYFVSGQDGWLRSITLSLLDEDNVMRGIVSTLHNISGALYVPVAAPIVFVKQENLEDETLGDVTPADPRHARYRALLKRAVEDGEAQLITI